MVSLSSARDASAASRMTCSAGMSSTLNGSPSVSLFWVSVPVLSAHSTSTPASSSIADQPADDRLFLGEEARADRHRHRQHRRHRHRNRGHGQHQGELQVVRIGSPRKIATAMITATRATARMIR